MESPRLVLQQPERCVGVRYQFLGPVHLYSRHTFASDFSNVTCLLCG